MTVIDIFFRFLNFALFVGVIGYYFRTRLLKNIYGQIKAKINSYKTATLSIKQAQSELKVLQKQIEDQKTEYHSLQDKIALWKNGLKQRDISCLQEQAALSESLAERTLLRKKTQAMCVEAQRVFPLIMNQATVELKSVFVDSQHQKNYNQKAIDALEHL